MTDEAKQCGHEKFDGACRFCRRAQYEEMSRAAALAMPSSASFAPAALPDRSDPTVTFVRPAGPGGREFFGADRYTCVNRLDPTGEEAECKVCGGGTKLVGVYGCKPEKYRICHPTLTLEGAQLCAQCNDRVPLPGYPDGYKVEKAARDAALAAKAAVTVPTPAARPAATPKMVVTRKPPRIEWVPTAQLAADTIALSTKVPADCSGVVGIPRSGMIPASILATYRHLPLFEMRADGPRLLARGGRGYAPGEGPLVLIDDTVYGGGAMGRAFWTLKNLGYKFLTAAVYVTPARAGTIDIHGRVLPAPHVLEWNVMNNGPAVGLWDGQIDPGNSIWGGGVALDFDGVICEECPVPDADDGPGLDRYGAWLADARPLMLARRVPVKLIVTGRIERWRELTVAWLHRHGMHVERLVMHPAATASQRDGRGDVAAIKAREFAASRCGVFIESERRQAQAINQTSRKPVICNTTGEVFQ